MANTYNELGYSGSDEATNQAIQRFNLRQQNPEYKAAWNFVEEVNKSNLLEIPLRKRESALSALEDYDISKIIYPNAEGIPNEKSTHNLTDSELINLLHDIYASAEKIIQESERHFR